MMKQVVSISVVVLMVTLASVAWAKGPANVTNGVHNLSATGVDPFTGVAGDSIYATNVSQVCVFCHTPHGSNTEGPLWNQNMPTPSAWNHYNSASLHINALLDNRVPNNESLICLSCHDGSISVNHVVNPPNDSTLPITTTFNGNTYNEIVDDLNGTPGKRIGASLNDLSGTGDLSDDHPISFSYDAVLAANDYNGGGGGAKQGELHPVADAETAGVRFFTSANNVECSSCHDPHVDYLNNTEYTPFLIMSNEGSALCFACHNK